MKPMNFPQPNLRYAFERGWISVPKPMKPTQDKWIALNYAHGLTARGTPRKSRPRIRAEILEAARRDGVGITAIYNRIKRTGKLTLDK